MSKLVLPLVRAPGASALTRKRRVASRQPYSAGERARMRFGIRKKLKARFYLCGFRVESLKRI